ncbi:glycoside hydrolase family 95 protein [Paenibacillus sp. MAH-34]|uniref:Glycoside hydrolase family 95 protein n=2 Tax=Paenibacillus TaxID=44249 RepID=A0ABW9U2L4_9BACL|nr:glycoside hydrolase family 95 protein [Paenibacillus anseongense]
MEVSQMNRIWFRQPAELWEEHALPIGNGRLGGMVFGGIECERIQFNEESLFTGRPALIEGAPYQEFNPIREHLKHKQYVAAQRHAETAFLKPASYGDESDFGMYQNFGDIFVEMEHPDGKVSDYLRELDLDEAIARVSYRCEDQKFYREYFSSCPDNVMVMRFRCSKPNALTMKLQLVSAQAGAIISYDQAGSRVTMNGSITNLAYEAQIRIMTKGGTIEAHHDALFIREADEVMLLLSAATDYDASRESFRGKDYTTLNRSVLDQAAEKSFHNLLAAHVVDYQQLFKRVELKIDGLDNDHLPTDERLQRYREGEHDVGLESLLFQYGRYLLISSSRPGNLPANLQGIWNNSNNPMWGSMFCYNINFNMNYWHAESTNLAECHAPMIDFIDRLRPSGRLSAKKFFNARGWFAAKKSDIWGFTQPYAAAVNGLFIGGAGWLCEDVWQVYCFNLDHAYLVETAYPIMKESAEFYLDYLTENEEGQLVSSPSTSPENAFVVNGQRCTVSDGCEMDHRIVESLFHNCLKACDILGIHDEFRAELERALPKVAPVRLGRYGQIQEWEHDWDDPEDQHRHVSQLFGLHPASLISPNRTHELAEGAKVVLNCRGDQGTGWSRAWKVNLWSRLQDGNRAYKLLRGTLEELTFDNLFNVHPPFQMDGNFGLTAGIAEMLLQSEYEGCIDLLPALPDVWESGYVSGLRAKGGYTVDLRWEQGGRRIHANLYGKSGKCGKLRSGNDLVEFQLNEQGCYTYRTNVSN